MGAHPNRSSRSRDDDVTQAPGSMPRPDTRPGGGQGDGAGADGTTPLDLWTEDVLAFVQLEAGMFLLFGPDGTMLWANDAGLAGLGATDATTPPVRLADLLPEPVGMQTEPGPGPVEQALPVDDADRGRAPALVVPTIEPGTGSGWRTGPVRTVDGRTAWWSWAAWCDPDGTVAVWAEDATAQFQEEATARARRAALAVAVEQCQSAISVTEVGGRLVLANRRHHEIVGRRDDTGLSPAEREVLHSGISIVADETVSGPAGERELHVVRFPLRGGDGRVTHVAALATDITDRARALRELAARQRLYDALVRASPDIVALVDARGRVVEVSDASYTALGFDRPVTIRQLWGRLDRRDREQLRRWLRRVVAGEELEPCRYHAAHVDGRELVFEAAARTVVGDDGAPDGAVVVIREITSMVGAEIELTRAAALAEEASRAKGELLSRMSTEMRGPIDDVLRAADRLGAEGLGDEQREAMEHIVRAGRHLRDLIDEVLDVARTEARDLDLVLEPLSATAVVADAANLARPIADQRSVRLVLAGVQPVDSAADGVGSAGETDGPGGDGGSATGAVDGPARASGRGDGGPWVLADRQRLLQALLNLLSNAIKYNHAGGTVRMSVSAVDDQVRLAVVDTGVGIAPENLSRLFEPFDRLGAEHSGIEGTGVGLTLTRNLVEQMGGAIEVASAVGTGSVFVIRLRRAAAPPGTGRPASGHAAGHLRVLLVEDDAASGELVRRIFARRGGVDLARVGDGESAIAAARSDRPDLVLLDLGLPDLAGDAVLAQLRGDPATADIPVVVVSADATEAQRRRLVAAGADAYLTKPLAVGELLAVVNALVVERGVGR